MSGFRQGRVATEPAARNSRHREGSKRDARKPFLATTTKLTRSWQCGTSEKTTTTEQPQSGLDAWAALVQLGRRRSFRDPPSWPTGSQTIRALTRVEMDRALSPV